MSKPKHFSWFKFEWDKWRNDPALRRCNKEAKGFWIDAIAVMEELDSYFLEGTPEDLCRDLVCTREEFDRSIIELKRTGTASISKNQGRVKIISRKILKDVNLTEYNRLKKQESRAKQRVKKVSNGSSKKEFKEEEVREDLNPLTPFNQNGQKGRISILKPEGEISVWMNAIATAVGAKDLRSLPKQKRWTDVCLICVRDDLSLTTMLDVIREELNRVGTDTQFFTPENCLQKLQISQTRKPVADNLPTFEEKQAANEAARQHLQPPPKKTAEVKI